MCEYPYYPFTAPSWMPRTRRFCSVTKTRIMGTTDMVMAAIIRLVCWPWLVPQQGPQQERRSRQLGILWAHDIVLIAVVGLRLARLLRLAPEHPYAASLGQHIWANLLRY